MNEVNQVCGGGFLTVLKISLILYGNIGCFGLFAIGKGNMVACEYLFDQGKIGIIKRQCEFDAHPYVFG